MEYTLSIIKPDGVEKNIIGKIYSKFENAGLKIVAATMCQLTKEQAREFYAIHKDRTFFNDLVDFIASGPVMVQVLAGSNAVAKNREVMGATNPKEAAKGTIRAEFAESIDKNIVHGSDSLDNAKIEINFFFPGMVK
jgi:nucleoside-diphosphate kinase